MSECDSKRVPRMLMSGISGGKAAAGALWTRRWVPGCYFQIASFDVVFGLLHCIFVVFNSNYSCKV